MFPIVIDANVFKTYYDSSVNDIPPILTACPVDVFEKLGTEAGYVAYFDDGGIIRQEWENLVDRDWFNVWFATQLIEARFLLSPQQKDPALEAKIKGHGFPAKGRDLTYVRVSRSIADVEPCTLLTEDLDFYDPPKKHCAHKTRIKILTTSSGKVAKELKHSDIKVLCVATA